MRRFRRTRSGAARRTASVLALDAETSLVPIARADAAPLFALVDRNRGWLIPWMPWAREATLGATEAFCAEAIAAAQTGSAFHFTLCRSGEPIGALGVHQIDRQKQSGLIGYWVDAEAAGRGLVTRAARALVSWAFDDLDLERIEVRIHPENARSRAVAERLGCQLEGRAREERMPEDLSEVDLFVLTAQRWRSGSA